MKEIYVKYGTGTENAREVLEKVSSQRIYFGHRSVGDNIIQGIEKWEKKTGVKLNIIETTDFNSVNDASLVHFKIGSNSDPVSKIDDFVSLVEQIPKEGNPIAFFKLCYVDVTGCTVAGPLFYYFKEKMNFLKETYPYIRFMVSTVPLMGRQRGIKAIAKKMLGRQPAGVVGNVRRSEFNDRLTKEFRGVLPVFDLGGIESTRPDGSLQTYKFNGGQYPCMYRPYTYDLGHLTDFGSMTLSYNLLAFLAQEFQ